MYTENNYAKGEWSVLGWECLKLATMGPVCALLVSVAVFHERRRKLVQWILLVILFVDLWVVSLTILPSGDTKILEATSDYRQRLQPEGAVTRFMERDSTTESRTYAVKDEKVFHLTRNALVRCWSMVDHAFSLRQQMSFKPADVGLLLSVFDEETWPGEIKMRLLRLLNCGSVLEFMDMLKYHQDGILKEPGIGELLDPLPRAFVVGGVRILDTPRNVLDLIGSDGFDPLATVAMDRNSVGSNRFTGLEPSRVVHNVDKIAYSPNRLDVQVQNSSNGMFVVTDTFYPGWQATVNGKPTPIYKVNFAFRGVLIPAGRNEISMVYRPWAFRVGLYIMGAALALCLALILAERRFSISSCASPVG
jgi:hypothetical protein